MQELTNWTLDAIRADDPVMSWMEERRFEWVPLVSDCIARMMEGYSLLVLTDKEREWFGKYAVSTINRSSKSRPYLPVYELSGMLPGLDAIHSDEQIELARDMLSVSFGGNYLFWYIGKSDDPRVKLAKKSDDSFLLVMDEEIQNSFFLRSADEFLDLKLLHLVRLFDKTLDGVLFNEITLQ